MAKKEVNLDTVTFFELCGGRPEGGRMLWFSDLRNALNAMFDAKFLSFDTIEKVMKIRMKVQALQAEYAELSNEIYKAHGEIQDDGSTTIKLDNPEFMKLNKKEVDLAGFKDFSITHSELIEAGFVPSPNEIFALNRVIKIVKGGE